MSKFKKLNKSFFQKNTILVAKNLLSKYLVLKNGKNIISGKIVETEAYRGENDLACHASKGRTKRTELLYQCPGTIYVYFIYGMYYCLNIVTEKKDFPSAVLIRAIEPKEGIELMIRKRKTKNIFNLTSGPGKLCQAFGIDKKFHGKNIFGDKIFIEDRGEKLSRKNIISAKRVGVDYAGVCKDYRWRFYIKNNKFISKY